MGPVNIIDPHQKSNITSQFLSIEDPVDSLHPQSGARLLISWAGAEHTHHIVHHTLLKCVTDKVRAVGKRESISHENNATRRVYQPYLRCACVLPEDTDWPPLKSRLKWIQFGQGDI